MGTSRSERETLVVFSEEDRLTGGSAVIYTFQESLKKKCLKAGGQISREHVRDGKVEAWDLRIPASLVRIAFKSQARSEASRKRGNLFKSPTNKGSQSKKGHV